MTSPAALRAAARIRLELENRAAMLSVHGGILLMIGVMMALTGAPAPTEEWFGPYSRLVVGGLAIVGGGTILVGVALTDESHAGWGMMAAGTLSACLWHLGLTATYAYAAVTEKIALLFPGETLSEAVTNRGYIPLVYLGYVLLILIHFVTLLRLGPPPR